MANVWTRIAASLAILVSAVAAWGTTVNGQIVVNGNPFNGYIVFTLSYPATNGHSTILTAPTAFMPVVNGNFTPFILDGNDTLLPKGTYYAVDYYNTYHNRVNRLNYFVTGLTFDLGAAVPTPILTNNVNFLDLLGLRSVSTNTLTVNNTFNVGQTTISNTGISNAQQLDNIEFASAYNVANPSSSTCGIMEAETDLPATGGIIYLPFGACTVTSSVFVTKPTVFVGYGTGGYSDFTTFTGVNSGTLLTQSTGGSPLFTIVPSAAGNLSGITLRDFAVKVSGGGDVISIGGATTSKQVSGVRISDVFTYGAQGCGVNIVGNVDGVYIDRSQFNSGVTSGICVSATSSYSVKGLYISNTTATRNAMDGMNINSPVVSTIDIMSSHFDKNTRYGLNVMVGSTASIVHATDSTFQANTRGIQMNDGELTSIGNNFASGGTQAYGAYIDTPTSTNSTASFKDGVWGGNTSADLFTGTNTYQVSIYGWLGATPLVSQATPGTVRYVVWASSPTLAHATLATISFTSCPLVVNGATDQNCSGTQSWGTTLPATYTAICQIVIPGFSGTSNTNGILSNDVVITGQTTTNLTYYLSNFHGVAGQTVTIN